MKKRKFVYSILSGVIVITLGVFSINAFANVNPCNPAPVQTPDGKAVVVDCTYGNITYKDIECCNDVYPNPPFYCEGWYQICPDPIPPS